MRCIGRLTWYGLVGYSAGKTIMALWNTTRPIYITPFGAGPHLDAVSPTYNRDAENGRTIAVSSVHSYAMMVASLTYNCRAISGLSVINERNNTDLTIAQISSPADSPYSNE